MVSFVNVSFLSGWVRIQVFRYSLQSRFLSSLVSNRDFLLLVSVSDSVISPPVELASFLSLETVSDSVISPPVELVSFWFRILQKLGELVPVI